MYKVYTQTNCVYCDKAKALLKEKNIRFEEILVNNNEEAKSFLKEKHLYTVPQIWNEDRHIGGFSELALNLK